MLECKNPIIGVDLDDVLWDLMSTWISRYNDMVDDNLTVEDIKSWDVAQYIKRGTEGILNYIPQQNDFWEDVEPIPDSKECLQQLIKDGYLIYVVTASSHTNLKEKMSRFYSLFPFIEEEHVVIIHRKQMMDLDMLIDDKPGNLEDANYLKVLFDRPHNRSIDENKISAVRLKTWSEIYKYIKQELPIERSYVGGN